MHCDCWGLPGERGSAGTAQPSSSRLLPNPVQPDLECFPWMGQLTWAASLSLCQCLPAQVVRKFSKYLIQCDPHSVPHALALQAPLQLSWSSFRHWEVLEGLPEPSPSWTIPALPAWLQSRGAPTLGASPWPPPFFLRHLHLLRMMLGGSRAAGEVGKKNPLVALLVLGLVLCRPRVPKVAWRGERALRSERDRGHPVPIPAPGASSSSSQNTSHRGSSGTTSLEK